MRTRWLSTLVRRKERRTTAGSPFCRRRARLEPLEDRRLLATFLVDNLNDAGAGSLRQAILGANAMTGADKIEFGSTAGTIALSSGQLTISEALTIDGPGDAVLSIDAQQNSRIFNISALLGNFTIDGLTLTGGRTTGDNADEFDTTHNGGAIRSLTSGDLTITNSTVIGNATTGYGADGGGIYASGNLTLTNSTISGNTTTGNFAYGGGVFSAAAVTLNNSVVSGNSTRGFYASGGGVYGYGDVTLTNCTVSGNHTVGVSADGGGVYSFNAVTLLNTTITGNHTEGEDAEGGGVFGTNLSLTNSTVSGNLTQGLNAVGGGVYGGDVTLVNSTVSGNHTEGTAGVGGGIYSYGNVTLNNSTVSGNHTAGDNAHGGGIYGYGDVTLIQSTITGNSTQRASASGGGIYSHAHTGLSGSIVSGNTAGGNNPDLLPVAGFLAVDFTLIGSNSGTSLAPAPVGSPDANGNLIGTATNSIDPLLGPLAGNGGPTMTHALSSASPAVDAGDPGAVAGAFDQRGSPFVRVFNGDGAGGARIDMGAFERQPIPPAVFGDYNNNGAVDAADYVVWRKQLGTSGVPSYSGADGDGDTTIDQDDYGVWRTNFGMTVPAPGAGSAAGVPTLSAQAIQIREPAELLPTETTAAPAETGLTAARAAGFALLDNPSRWQDWGSRPRGRIQRFGLAESGSEDLLLLAIDRTEHASPRDVAAVDRDMDDLYAHDWESQWLVDESPTTALAEWRTAWGASGVVRR